MYRILFNLAGFGIFGWALLILFPTWRLSRRVAESAIIPVYVAVIYLVGVIAVFRELGFGIMADFGTADGVLGLLRNEPVAMVAWIHILAFDQVVAHLIYRDNMRHHFVPVPVQSVLLFLTLMLGPLGFLSYWAIRTIRTRELVGWGERTPEERPAQRETRFAAVVTERSLIGAALQLWKREAQLVQLAGLALLLALICAIIALVNGSWQIGAEGRLKEAVRFDVALAIFTLTQALLVPLAGFSEQESRRWHRWFIGLTLFAYFMENVQVWRGIDPRFSAAPLDQALGGVFFLSALGLMVLFIQLMSRFYRRDTLADHPALRVALVYAANTAFLGYAVGVVISGLRSRYVGGGNMMLLHAGGFHGLQFIPLVALLAGWSSMSAATAVRTVHIAGTGYLIFCSGLALQAFTGNAPLTPTAFTTLSLAGAGVWAAAFVYASAQRVSALQAAPSS